MSSTIEGSESFKALGSNKIRSLVPWETPRIFRKVYEYLYSPELTKKRWAVDELAVWESRCHPSLGAAIEASALITRAIIQDVLMTNGNSLSQAKDVEMMYCTGIMRFVTLSVESHLTQAKQSLAQVANSLGIPAWIVDVRNEAAHSYSPSLPILRMAAEAAMQYLDKVFWSVEASSELKEIITEPVESAKIQNELNRYVNHQFNIIKKKKKSLQEDNPENKEMRKILKFLRQNICKNRKKFINILLLDGFLIPHDDDMNQYLKSAELKNFQIGLEEDYERNNNLHTDKENVEADIQKLPKLPTTLAELWWPLIRMLNKFDAIPDLLESLLYTQHCRSPAGQKILLSWVKEILEPHLLLPDFSAGKLQKIFCKENAMFNWDRLLYAAIANPCKYTVFIFPVIVSQVNLHEKYIRRLMNLLAISQGLSLAKGYELPDDHTTFTLKDLEITKKLEDTERRKRKKINVAENLFQPCLDFDSVRNIPIGGTYCDPISPESELNAEDSLDLDSAAESEFVQKYLPSNENDSEEDMEVIVTPDLNTFEDDEQILRKKGRFLYRRKF